MSALDYVPGYVTLKHLTGLAEKPPVYVGLAQVQAAWSAMNCTTVCVWEPSGGVGHAAIAIGNATIGSPQPDTTTSYASWFPGGDGVQGKQDIITDLASVACSFQDDCQSEGDGNGGYRIPEHMIRLPNLNTPAMQAEWDRIRGNQAIYNLLKNNCSDIVARILRQGFSSWQMAKFAYFSYCSYWTPTDIRKLAYLVS